MADIAQGAVIGDDGVGRCPWAVTHPLNQHYHDTEWGMPVRGEAPLFERIMLEAFQSGLSWLTILRKREAFRAAFVNFDPEVVATFDQGDIDRLMADVGIVRNRRKIDAAIINARAVLALRCKGGLDAFVWSRGPESPIGPATTVELPTQTPESAALAKDLKAAGFVFVGPTTAYALMTAIGMDDGHLIGCHRRSQSGVFTAGALTRH